MDGLVTKLSTGKHPVVLEHRTEDLSEIKERIAQGLVFIKFIETQGGTELGINVDPHSTHLEEANFETGEGTIQVAGTCELNFEKVRCMAEIDLATRHGKGNIELLIE